MHKHVYMPMLQTAETVARRYGISRDRQDEYALKSQQRTAAGQAAGRWSRHTSDPSGSQQRCPTTRGNE